jgi:hypothetical protein
MSDDTLDTGTSEASDVALLSEGEDSKEAETSEDETPAEETSEGEEEEPPLEEEEEKPEEEEEIDDKDITRTSWKTIKEKYPDLAKDKDFQNMFHREKAFSEVFPTVEDAREASVAAQTMEFFDNSLVEGDPKVLLSALNENVVTKFAENVLPALYQVNPSLFARATQPLMIELLNSVAERAESTKDENLAISAKNIAKFIFGKFEIPSRTQRTTPELEQERQRLQQERQTIAQRTENQFFERADKSIARQLRKVVEEGLDPKGELSDFTKNALVKQIIEDTKSTLMTDEMFKSKVKNLHRLARNAGFPEDYLPRFISTYLGRAKSLALTLRAKHKSAAVGKRTVQPKTRIEGSSRAETKQISKDTKGSSKKSDLDIILEGT